MKLSNHIIMTDDCNYARASIFQNNANDTFIPIISCPRFFRPDVKFEILKRIRLIQKSGFKDILYKGENYNDLRDSLKPFGINVIEVNSYSEESNIDSNHKLLLKLGYVIDKLNDHAIYRNAKNTESCLMIIERSELVYELISILWANYYNYDILLLDEIRDKQEEIIEKYLNDLVDPGDNCQILIDKLSFEISKIYDYKNIQEKWTNIQFVTNKLIVSIPIINSVTATIFHVDCGLKFLDDFVSLNTKSMNNLPIYLLVDVGDENITSEIPQVVQEISKKSQWCFHVCGDDASVYNFKLFCRFFPFDFLHVSGHGSSPNVRIVEYEYSDSNNVMHRIKLIEYFQFLRKVEDKIEVESRKEFLEVDGISWSNKEEIRKLNFSLPDYINCKTSRMVKEEPYNSNILQGILLKNGVFFGNINHFASMDTPILFLNTCGSLMRVSEYLNYAGAKAIIGSMWSIYDKSAVEFSEFFFIELNTSNICNAFFEAKNSLSDNYTKYAYQFIGTLNCRFNSGIDEFDIEEQKYMIILKFIDSLEFAMMLKRFNLIHEEDLENLRKIFNIAELISQKIDKSKDDVFVRLKAIRSNFNE